MQIIQLNVIRPTEIPFDFSQKLIVGPKLVVEMTE